MGDSMIKGKAWVKWCVNYTLIAISYDISEDGIVAVATTIGENLGLVLSKVDGAIVQGAVLYGFDEEKWIGKGDFC